MRTFLKKTLSLLVFLSLLLALGSVALPQDSASTKANAGRIEILVKQLASSRDLERKEAQKEIEKMGESALSFLRAAVKDGDAETSRRAADMLAQLERKLARSGLLAPRMVKLSVKDQSIRDAVALLSLKDKSDDFGLPMTWNNDVHLVGDAGVAGSRKMSVETGEVTFFEALDKLCAAAGMVERHQPQGIADTGPQPIVLEDGEFHSLPTHFAGAVRVRLLPSKSFYLKGQQGESPLVIEVAIDSHLNGISVQEGPSIIKAIDDQGQTLAPVKKPATAKPAVKKYPWRDPDALPSVSTRLYVVPVKLGAKQAKELKELTGSLKIQANVPPVLAKIDNVLKAQNQSIACKDCDINSLTLLNITKKARGVYHVSYTIACEGFGPPGVHQERSVSQVGYTSSYSSYSDGVRLVDADGNACKVVGLRSSGDSKKWTVDVEFRADAGQGDPARLEIIGNGTQRNRDRHMVSQIVPFAFKDIPLP